MFLGSVWVKEQLAKFRTEFSLYGGQKVKGNIEGEGQLLKNLHHALLSGGCKLKGKQRHLWLEGVKDGLGSP